MPKSFTQRVRDVLADQTQSNEIPKGYGALAGYKTINERESQLLSELAEDASHLGYSPTGFARLLNANAGWDLASVFEMVYIGIPQKVADRLTKRIIKASIAPVNIRSTLMVYPLVVSLEHSASCYTYDRVPMSDVEVDAIADTLLCVYSFWSRLAKKDPEAANGENYYWSFAERPNASFDGYVGGPVEAYRLGLRAATRTHNPDMFWDLFSHAPTSRLSGPEQLKEVADRVAEVTNLLEGKYEFDDYVFKDHFDLTRQYVAYDFESAYDPLLLAYMQRSSRPQARTQWADLCHLLAESPPLPWTLELCALLCALIPTFEGSWDDLAQLALGLCEEPV